METCQDFAGGNSLPEALFIAFEVLAGRALPSAELARGVGQATIRAQIAHFMRWNMEAEVYEFIMARRGGGNTNPPLGSFVCKLAKFNAERDTPLVQSYVDCLYSDGQRMGDLEMLAFARLWDVVIIVCRSGVDPGYLYCRPEVVNGYRYGLRPALLVLHQPEFTYKGLIERQQRTSQHALRAALFTD